MAEVEAATEEANDVYDAEEEESEEEANKENTPPNHTFLPDVCDDMNFVLMASPVLDKVIVSPLFVSRLSPVVSPVSLIFLSH